MSIVGMLENTSKSVSKSGHSWERKQANIYENPGKQRFSEEKERVKQASYYYVGLALSAKLALVDGALDPKEFNECKKLFVKPLNISTTAENSFADACRDKMPPRYFAKKLMAFFPNEYSVYEAMARKLFYVATADGSLNPQEIKMLKEISDIWEIEDQTFAKWLEMYILPAHFVSKKKDPRQIFGGANSGDSSPEKIKKSYRHQMQLYHPDRMGELMNDSYIADLVNTRITILSESFTKLTRKSRSSD